MGEIGGEGKGRAEEDSGVEKGWFFGVVELVMEDEGGGEGCSLQETIKCQPAVKFDSIYQK